MVGSLRYEIASKVADGDTAEAFLVRAADWPEPAVLKLFKRRERSEAAVAGLLGQLCPFRKGRPPPPGEHLDSGRALGGKPYLAMAPLGTGDRGRALRRAGPLRPRPVRV